MQSVRVRGAAGAVPGETTWPSDAGASKWHGACSELHAEVDEMITAKKIATLALTSIGGFAGATAIYLGTHPGVFIGRTPGHVATLLKVAPHRTAVRVVPAPAPRFLKLEPVMITTRTSPDTHTEAAMDMESEDGDTASNGVPGSDWHGLATSPDGKRGMLLSH